MSDLLKNKKHIYFLGIGGVGMSALAKILHHQGFTVSGSDAKESKYVKSLRECGIPVHLGHNRNHLKDVDLVIYSSAIQQNNAEFILSRKLGIPSAHRAQALSSLINGSASIAITGMHGKSTTSALISYLLDRLGDDPTCLVGGEMLNFNDNVRLGNDKLFVAEVDESDKSQRYFFPDYLVITNIEEEHLDIYEDLKDIKSTFLEFINNNKKDKILLYSYECENLRSMLDDVTTRKISYGFSEKADFSAQNIRLDNFNSSFTLFHRGRALREISLHIPGRHNILNAMGAISLLITMGKDIDRIEEYVKEFRGVSRRQEIKLDRPELLVLDDYAHHPTEIRETLKALKSLGRQITAVFQPHRYTRTRHLASSFGSAFNLADRLIITDIYSAGEDSIPLVDSGLIYREVIKEGHPDARIVQKDELFDFLLEKEYSGEIVIFLGAGDIGELCNEFVKRYEDRICAQRALR